MMTCPPSEFVLKTPLRPRLDLLEKSTRGFVELKQAEQKQYHYQNTKLQCWFSGSSVSVQNYHGDNRWIPGTTLHLEEFGNSLLQC